MTGNIVSPWPKSPPAMKKMPKKMPLQHTLSPVKTPVRPKMLAAFRVMPKLYNLSTIRKTKNTNTFANGWAKILIHASSTSVALAGEWMISSALLVRPGGGSIINKTSQPLFPPVKVA